ncbi:Exocyst complex component 1 [Grifola frondosa]|uniref:Exocyst complex component 1 n=1 Tax=Grifola frondosa TaxID=5627 RepID=A0A1C7MTX5_GRIFR|nr:Exocyst complex component 1 [Grifola frondosa]
MRTSTSTSVSSPVPSIVFPATTPSIKSAVPPVSSDSRTSSSASELPFSVVRVCCPLETPPLTVVPSTSSRRTPSRTPSRAPSMGPVDPGQPRPQQNARVSFFDPANQATLNRLLSGDVVVHDEGEGEGDSVGDGGEESTQATLASVEEMLEGYEWASDDIMGRRAMTGTADQIEARLLDELMALDKVTSSGIANIHSFIESDDRINIVLKYMDAAISELDNMDSVVSSYKIHLNAVSDDIAYIQSQNRGLQVQTQNQRTLLTELEELLQTVQVDRSALLTLTQESLEKASSIQNLEAAATELYKALQAGRDRDMAATMERLDEYKTYNGQFCKRMLDYLSIMFTAQSKLLLGDNNGVVKPAKGRPSIVPHKPIEEYLGRYAGLMLYMKEMDESVYGKICAAYFSAASSLHATQIKALLGMYGLLVKKSTDEELDGFGGVTPTTNAAKVPRVRRAGTIVRSPLEGRRDRKDPGEGDMRASDAFGGVLEQIASTIYREEEFIADFLQINDVALTFADYMGLENYFRRQAARAAGLSQATSKLVRGAMDLIFGFLPIEVKAWLDAVMTKDNLQIVGMIACLERFLTDAEERGNAFLLSLLEKQHVRLKGLFERRVNDHIKSIEDTKLTSKKRKGVAPFIKYFPTYIGRVENQLIGSDTLEIRQIVDTAYDKIVQAMFDALKQMAKMDGEGEDKGQLNYHVIIIENMHYFVAEISVIEIGSVAVFLKRAETIYEENLNAYVKIVLRRPFSKIIEYFEGVERLLKTTAPSEISSNSSYSKSALKKVVKEYNSKDVRKHIDALFKRVEKHFTEASEKTTTEDAGANTGIASGTVMVGVWKACEEELLRITELFSKRISQCYKDTGVSLEYTAADVETAFKRHRSSYELPDYNTQFEPQENDEDNLWEVIEVLEEKGNRYKLKKAHMKKEKDMAKKKRAKPRTSTTTSKRSEGTTTTRNIKQTSALPSRSSASTAPVSNVSHSRATSTKTNFSHVQILSPSRKRKASTSAHSEGEGDHLIPHRPRKKRIVYVESETEDRISEDEDRPQSSKEALKIGPPRGAKRKEVTKVGPLEVQNVHAMLQGKAQAHRNRHESRQLELAHPLLQDLAAVEEVDEDNEADTALGEDLADRSGFWSNPFGGESRVPSPSKNVRTTDSPQNKYMLRQEEEESTQEALGIYPIETDSHSFPTHHISPSHDVDDGHNPFEHDSDDDDAPLVPLSRKRKRPELPTVTARMKGVPLYNDTFSREGIVPETQRSHQASPSGLSARLDGNLPSTPIRHSSAQPLRASGGGSSIVAKMKEEAVSMHEMEDQYMDWNGGVEIEGVVENDENAASLPSLEHELSLGPDLPGPKRWVGPLQTARSSVGAPPSSLRPSPLEPSLTTSTQKADADSQSQEHSISLSQIKDLTDALAEKSEHAAQLEAQMAEMRERIAELDSENAKQRTTSEAEVKKLTDALDGQIEHASDLEEIIAELQTDLEKLASNEQLVTGQVKQLTDECEEKQEQISQLENQLVEVLAEIAAVRSDADELLAKSSTLESENEARVLALATAEEKVARLELELTVLRQDRADIEKASQATTENFEASIRDLQQSKQAVEDDRDRLNVLYVEASDRVSALNTSLTEEMTKLATLTKEHEVAIQDHQRKKTDAESDRDLFRSLYDKASDYAAGLTKENKDLEERATLAEGQKDAGLKMVKGMYEQRVKVLQAEAEKWKGMYKVLTDRDTRTDDDLRRRAALEPQLQEDNTRLMAENAQLRSELQKGGALPKIAPHAESAMSDDEDAVVADVSNNSSLDIEASLTASPDLDDLFYLCQYVTDTTTCNAMFHTPKEVEEHSCVTHYADVQEYYYE